MTSASFSALATVPANTKRATVSGGKRGTATAYLVGLSILPLDPVDAELRQRQDLQSNYRVFQTMVEGDLDIIIGDVLTVSGTDYKIIGVEKWTYEDAYNMRLFVEDNET